MNATPDSDTAACEECGYSLAGRVGAPGVGACPECGYPFYAASQWHPRPLAPMGVLMIQFCAPMTTLLLLFLIGVLFGGKLGGATLPLLIFWLVLVVAFGISWPLGFAKLLVQQSVPRNERGSLTRRLLLMSFVINIIQFSVALVVAFRLA